MSEAERLGTFRRHGPRRPPRGAQAQPTDSRPQGRRHPLSKGDTSSDVFFVLEGRLQVLLYSANRPRGFPCVVTLTKATCSASSRRSTGKAGRPASSPSRIRGCWRMTRADFRTAIEASPDASMSAAEPADDAHQGHDRARLRAQRPQRASRACIASCSKMAAPLAHRPGGCDRRRPTRKVREPHRHPPGER